MLLWFLCDLRLIKDSKLMSLQKLQHVFTKSPIFPTGFSLMPPNTGLPSSVFLLLETEEVKANVVWILP